MKQSKSNDFAMHIFHGHIIYLQRCFYWHRFDMGVESRDGGVYNRPGHASLEVTSSAWDTDHNWSRHLPIPFKEFQQVVKAIPNGLIQLINNHLSFGSNERIFQN